MIESEANTEKSSVREIRQTPATLLIIVASIVAVGLSVEITHRLRLFWFCYSSQPGMNHVADGYFSMAYMAASAATMISLAAFWMHRKRGWRTVSGILGLLNLSLWLGMSFMHNTGMLVTYTEFVTVFGP